MEPPEERATPQVALSLGGPAGRCERIPVRPILTRMYPESATGGAMRIPHIGVKAEIAPPFPGFT